MTDERSTVVAVYFDGASKGNPGPAGAGAYIMENGCGPFLSLSTFVGRHETNNAAEYEGAILGLKAALKFVAPLSTKIKVVVRGDSKLAVEQLKGRWECRSANLIPRLERAQELICELRALGVLVLFEHVPRAANARADKLANEGVLKGKA